jgi:GDP-L-fucose synthase
MAQMLVAWCFMFTDFFKDKKVLILGGTGFVGTHFVEALLPLGAKICVTKHRRAPLIKNANIEVVEADLMQQDTCRQVMKGMDYVIHAAGAVSAAGVTTGTNPMSAITTNLALTANALEAAWAVGVQRILIFGSSTGYPVTEHPVREDEMWSGPTHASYFGYGWMRRYLERMAEFVTQKSKVGVALVRPTAVYGQYDDFDPVTSHVIPALIQRSVAKENPFVVWGTGDEVRDFLHIRDLVRGCLMVLEKQAVCDPINIGYGKEVTIREIVQMTLKAAEHYDADIQFDASKPTTIPKRMVDVTKAKRLLNFEPSISLEDGLKETVDWYRLAVLKQ